MARMAREKSETGIYHVMLRGIDKRDIFLTNSDYEKFIECLKKSKKKASYTIYAYCLMTNHIHMLIKAEEEEIGDTIRRITVSYAQYYNIKNGRTGHLFQNRFKSEPVNTDRYFLTVLRYIHQNPVKAGMVENVEDYRWSSYNIYAHKNSLVDLIDIGFGLGYFRDIEEFKVYTNEKTEDKCLEYEPIKRYRDEELKDMVSLLVNIPSLKTLDIETRDKKLKLIKEETGASNRQLSRVLEIGRGILDRIK